MKLYSQNLLSWTLNLLKYFSILQFSFESCVFKFLVTELLILKLKLIRNWNRFSINKFNFSLFPVIDQIFFDEFVAYILVEYILILTNLQILRWLLLNLWIHLSHAHEQLFWIWIHFLVYSWLNWFETWDIANT